MKKIVTTLPEPAWDDSVTHNLELVEVMDYKEEARRLIEKFEMPVDFAEGNTVEEMAESIFKQAKQCALIAIDLIYEFMNMDDEYNKDFHMSNTHWVGYWAQVKEEIQKL